MRPIPAKLKREIESDPFYRRCCITHTPTTKEKIDWHHNFVYAGRQLNEKWCILPVTQEVHKNVEKYRDLLNWIMYNRATDEKLRAYSKAVDLIYQRERLNKKYGVYKEEKAKI